MKITLRSAKEKYGLINEPYSSARTWKKLSCLPLPEDFIREFQDKVNWENISDYQKLSESFIREFQDKVNWYFISSSQKLSEGFIKEFQNKVYWRIISIYQKLSEAFIREFQDKVDWYDISIYQKLSEDFIREFQDKAVWFCISKYQKLSESFIEEFQDKVNWENISKYQVISPAFARKFGIIIDNNSQRTVSEWKRLVQDTGLYECHKDYFYAYKGIRSDRYSNFNFQYQYLPGETYECFSDYSNDKYSFGLSAWIKEEAEKYCNELVVKIKVYYRDVTAVIHNGGKIRCKKLIVKE